MYIFQRWSYCDSFSGQIANQSAPQWWTLAVRWGKSPWGSFTLRPAQDARVEPTCLRTAGPAACPSCHHASLPWAPRSACPHLGSAPTTARRHRSQPPRPVHLGPNIQRRTPRERSWWGTLWVKTSLWWTYWTRVAGRPPWTWWRGSSHQRRRSWRGPSSAGRPQLDPDCSHRPPGAQTGGTLQQETFKMKPFYSKCAFCDWSNSKWI